MSRNWQQYCTHDDKNIKGFFGPYRWLSNFHLNPVYSNDIYFPSAENAFQAAKCINNSDKFQFTKCSPVEAKYIGRQVKIIDCWDTYRIRIMYDVLREKFTDQELKEKLLETGDRYLEETNDWGDNFWGVDIKNPTKGLNVLGKILMEIRRQIKFEIEFCMGQNFEKYYVNPNP